MDGWTSLLVLVLVAVATGACAADGERRARAAHDADPIATDAPDAIDPGAIGAADGPAASAPEVRPRLRHTVTLGESVGGGVTDDRATPGPSFEPSSPVIVIVEPSHGGWGYGAPGWVSSPGWDAWSPYPGWHGRVPADPSVRPPPRRPWSPPPEYGPRFPFKTAPADPWR